MRYAASSCNEIHSRWQLETLRYSVSWLMSSLSFLCAGILCLNDHVSSAISLCTRSLVSISSSNSGEKRCWEPEFLQFWIIFYDLHLKEQGHLRKRKNSNIDYIESNEQCVISAPLKIISAWNWSHIDAIQASSDRTHMYACEWRNHGTPVPSSSSHPSSRVDKNRLQSRLLVFRSRVILLANFFII